MLGELRLGRQGHDTYCDGASILENEEDATFRRDKNEEKEDVIGD